MWMHHAQCHVLRWEEYEEKDRGGGGGGGGGEGRDATNALK